MEIEDKEDQPNNRCTAEIVTAQFLYRITRELTSNLELRVVLKRVLNLAMEHVQAENGSIIVLNEKLEPLDSVVIHRGRIIEDTIIQLKEVLEKGLAGWVLRNRQAVWIANTSTDKRWLARSDRVQGQEVVPRSAVCAPLLAKDQLVGVMTLVHSQPYCLTQDHLELVQAIADQAGIAVLNARLYAESQQRLIDLEGAHEQYREWQSSLTAMVYHDIRSPLSNIHNSLHLLESMLPQSEKPAFEPVLAIAQRGVERIQRLTSSLLDLSRLEAGQVLLKRTAVESLKLLYDAVEVVTPLAKEKDQPIMLDVSEELPPVFVDEDMMLRVFINLLENASKYTPSKLPIIVGAKKELQAEDADENRPTRGCWIQFWVKDSGGGISEEEKERIFNKFSRLERHQGKAGGYGLGLAFCRLAVEAHGGQLWVESQQNQGASFHVRLPYFQS